jgi:N-methylhydantoinase A
VLRAPPAQQCEKDGKPQTSSAPTAAPFREKRATKIRRGPKIRCGIDTGGTFTDLIGIDEGSGDLIVGKFPSSPKDPVKSIVGVIAESTLDVSRTASIVLGTTLGLNALLQRQGARVIFVTTAGFEDVLFIQRMNRRHHLVQWVKPKPLAER